MIPLCVSLKGFLSYRDKVTFTFDGASLWVLTGKNGAGKSAVFDAILFALYGVTRGDDRTAMPLINHQSERLMVEFEFEVGADRYLIKRIAQRKGRNTIELFHLSGPNAPYPGRPGKQPVLGAGSENGFKNCIRQIIGLNDKTFTASALLQQGKSEVMLEARPAKRHEMLSELVDISAYQKLEQKAKTRQNEKEGDFKRYQTQLDQLAPVKDEEITALEQEIEATSENLGTLQARLEKIIAWQVHAERWENLNAEKGRLEQAIVQADQLLINATQIEEDASRLVELQAILPILERLRDELDRLSQCRQYILEQGEEVERQQKLIDELQPEWDSAMVLLEQLRQQQGEQRAVQTKANETLQNSEADFHKINEGERIYREIETIDLDLAAFSDDLDKQVIIHQREVERVQELRTNLPHLGYFAEARASWHMAQRRIEEGSVLLAELQANLEAARAARLAAETARDEALEFVGSSQQAMTKMETLLSEVTANIERFHQLEGKTNCHYCGQLLTSEHLEQEGIRLEEAKEAAEIELQKARQTLEESRAEWEARKGTAGQRAQEEQQLGQQIQKVEAELKTAGYEQQTAEKQAANAWAALSVDYRKAISSLAGESLVDYWATEYPTSAELQGINSQIEQHAGLTARLKEYVKQQNERNSLQQQKIPLTQRLQVLRGQYPPERVKHILDERYTAQAAKEESEGQLTTLFEAIARAEGKEKGIRGQIEGAKRRQVEADRMLRMQQASEKELLRAIEMTKASLPSQWQGAADSFSQSQLESWQEEACSLNGAEGKFADLQAARSQRDKDREGVVRIEGELAVIPSEAQVALSTLEEREKSLKSEKDELEARRGRAEVDKNKLQQQMSARREVEKKLQEARKQASLYKELAMLFGREHLQRFLLQQIEAVIVRNANDVLDRISGGTLRLALNEQAGSSGQVKALDIVAYNSQTADGLQPIGVAYLSGSQRFRVAVSLALGIGRYASEGTKRVESVIIDEGFGGLDREGREQIIEQLRELKDTLRKIILVSHQEEFAEAFKNTLNQNVYEIRLENGTSTLTRSN